MQWLSTGDPTDDQKEDKDDPLDLSQLGTGAGEDQGDVEAPVTSGSDPSSWDPINIDQIPE